MNLPNWITLIRILLVPFFFTSLVSYQPGEEKVRLAAFIILLAACFTDALDGFLARVTKSKTALGTFLDPLADKLILLSGYLGLLFVEFLPFKPPLWVTVTIVFRDLVIVVGMLVIFITNGSVRVIPNFLGKCTTAFQMATLLSILLGFRISIVLCYITAALTIISCLSYVAREMKLLKGIR